MHLRLEDVFGGDEWFDSLNVIFIGDLLQLPPVNGAPVFEKLCYVRQHYGCSGLTLFPTPSSGVLDCVWPPGVPRAHTRHALTMHNS